VMRRMLELGRSVKPPSRRCGTWQFACRPEQTCAVGRKQTYGLCAHEAHRCRLASSGASRISRSANLHCAYRDFTLCHSRDLEPRSIHCSSVWNPCTASGFGSRVGRVYTPRRRRPAPRAPATSAPWRPASSPPCPLQQGQPSQPAGRLACGSSSGPWSGCTPNASRHLLIAE
jgi:hypothetical protein